VIQRFHAAIYARVSTADQSVEMQLEPCRAALRAWATRRGGELGDVELFEETGSGVKHLPIRQTLIHKLEQRELRPIEVVAVWAVDRLGRDSLDILQVVDAIGRLGVDLVVATQPFDTSFPLGKAMMQLAALFAELDRKLALERVRAGIRRAQEKGVRFGRPPICLSVGEVLEECAHVAPKALSRNKSLELVARRLGVSRPALVRWAARQNPPVDLPLGTPGKDTAETAAEKGDAT
jgi:DNA invertase Pin-like site-specific DNA recombinase